MNLLKINLGSGLTKIPDFINVDLSDRVKPEVVHDIRKPLPFENASAEMVVLTHVIEHLREPEQISLLLEINRVLAPEGVLIISYPEFPIIAQYYIDNKNGMRDYWKLCIYGRQNDELDTHLTLMDTRDFRLKLDQLGFTITKEFKEPNSDYNTVLHCTRKERALTYEEHLAKTVYGV